MEDIIAQVEKVLRIGLTVIAAYLVALWIASIWWTFRDIRSRTTDIFLQIAATLLVATFSFAGLVIYFILRPPKTLAELYEESLEEEAFLQGIHVQTACPVCKQRAEPEFVFCPWCQTRLKRLCIQCERPLMLRWKMCPYCGQATQAGHRVPPEEPVLVADETALGDEATVRVPVTRAGPETLASQPADVTPAPRSGSGNTGSRRQRAQAASD